MIPLGASLDAGPRKGVCSMELAPLSVLRNVECADLVELQAKMLCYGFRADDTTRHELRDRFGIDTGFIHGTVFATELGFRVNTSILDYFTENANAIELKICEGKPGFAWNGRFVECAPIRQPDLLFHHRADGVLWHDIARMHGPRILFLTPVRQCVLGLTGDECRFCTFEMRRIELVSAEAIVSLVRAVQDSTGEQCEIAIGGGTPNLRDFGADYYGNIVRELVTWFRSRVSVELIPPEQPSLQSLIDSGVSSLIMSIEIWDSERRKRIMPGKAKVSRERYLDAWRQSVAILGPGAVSSVLLVGLDDEGSLLEGAEAMIRSGVVPTLIPFRPYDECAMRRSPLTDHRSYLRCSYAVSEMLHRHGLKASRQAGCTACGACSLEVALEDRQTSPLPSVHMEVP